MQVDWNDQRDSDGQVQGFISVITDISDMTMPGMTGDVLARKLQHQRPDIPVIICTGYSHKINDASEQELGLAGVLCKLLIMRDLALAVRKALDDRLG